VELKNPINQLKNLLINQLKSLQIMPHSSLPMKVSVGVSNKLALLSMGLDIKPPPSLVTGDALLSAKDKLKPTEVHL